MTSRAMTNDAQKSTRPKLARGVRYRWDEVRELHQLLYPEGLLVLNETGAAIVQLCDGRSADEIKQELAGSFSDSQIDSDVDDFLKRLAQRGLIRHDANS
ncbi:pyrroloquinoline quinone biosynthesis peptide chaperone PqqD [Pirellulales bacterium]|nr:pyrroloquinoline quinone biosynthesis peptide chaperone PqqD [Pirellulales bacterium]